MKKIQDLFIKLVKIDSPFGQEKKVADFVIKELKKLNLIIKQDKFGNIIARSKKFNPKDSILFCAHLDTVESNKGIKPRVKNGVIYSDGKHILGADNKAAIAEIIYSLQKVKDFSNVELLFTVQEENGLVGVKNLDKKLIKSKRALVLDYSAPVGYIILSAPSAVILKIKIFGRASHGARTHLGENAIVLAAEAINRFKFKNHKGLSCNIGLIKGGTAVNVVADFIEIDIAIRSFSENSLKKIIKEIETHLKKTISGKKVRLSIEKTRVGFGYSYSKQDQFVKELIKDFTQIGIKVKFADTLGLSDGNILNHYGIKTIELGYGPKNSHSNNESVAIKEMEKMSQFLASFL